MSKIYYDATSLNNLIIERLNKASGWLKKSVLVSQQLNVPHEFNYSKSLYNLKSSLNNDFSIINNSINIINKSSTMFNRIKDSSNLLVSGIENYSLSLRESSIK